MGVCGCVRGCGGWGVCSVSVSVVTRMSGPLRVALAVWCCALKQLELPLSHSLSEYLSLLVSTVWLSVSPFPLFLSESLSFSVTLTLCHTHTQTGRHTVSIYLYR